MSYLLLALLAASPLSSFLQQAVEVPIEALPALRRTRPRVWLLAIAEERTAPAEVLRAVAAGLRIDVSVRCAFRRSSTTSFTAALESMEPLVGNADDGTPRSTTSTSWSWPPRRPGSPSRTSSSAARPGDHAAPFADDFDRFVTGTTSAVYWRCTFSRTFPNRGSERSESQ